MDESCILWHCLHDGPVAIKDIGKALLASNDPNWEVHRKNNVPLLKKIIETYGTCGLIAKADDKIVGFIRFYPKALNAMELAGMMCLQQFHPAGPSEKFVEEQFPAFEDIKDKTLEVHCVMTSRPYISSELDTSTGRNWPPMAEAGARKGVGLKLALGLVSWAREHDWKKIVTGAHADLDCMYGQYGAAGKAFWEKAGFKVIESRYEEWTGPDKWKATVESQAEAKGMSKQEAWTRYHMAYDL